MIRVPSVLILSNFVSSSDIHSYCIRKLIPPNDELIDLIKYEIYFNSTNNMAEGEIKHN